MAYSEPSRGNTVAVVVASLAGVWTVGVAIVPQAVVWALSEVLVASGFALPGWGWVVTPWLSATFIAVPALLLARIPRSVPVRWAGRAWLAAALSLGVLGSIRAVPAGQHELYLALLAGGAAGLAVAVTAANRSHDPKSATVPGVPATLLGLAAGTACLVPWLWLGALGGILETLLAVAAAAAIGWLASAILNDRFWAAFATASRARLTAVGGLVASGALAPLAAGAGAGAIPLAALLAVPPLGFAAAALQPMVFGRNPWPVRALVGTAIAGPLALVDPDETGLLLNFGTRDALFWAAIAAAAGLITAAATGLAYSRWLVHRGQPVTARPPRRLAAAGTAAAVGVAAILVYAVPGQPGLFGERLFVVLKEQADLAGLAGIADREQRVTATYRRLAEHAERTQAGLRRQLDRWRLSFTPYYLVNAVEVSGGPTVRAFLEARDDVDRVLLSPRLRPLPAAAPTKYGDAAAPEVPQWNITELEADQVWRDLGITGRGVVVGTSDSGVDGTHPALRDGFRGGDDSWYDPWNHTRAPTDHGGHGTHTLGSAVGRTADGGVPGRAPVDDGVPGRAPGADVARSLAAVGIAPGTGWVGCVNLDRNLGNPAHYLDCLQFMLAPFPPGGDPSRDGRPARAPHILTNSWGCPKQEGCDQDALRAATAALAAAGIFFVAAAGNEGPYCGSVDDPPAPYADVLTVGAVDRSGNVPTFSSRGPTPGGLAKPDIVAPGEHVLSTMPGGTYGELDGTSMATPHVAGVVALMWSANPGLIGDIARTRQILVDTAKPPLPNFSQQGGDDVCGGQAFVRGAGIVNALAAVRAAGRLSG